MRIVTFSRDGGVQHGVRVGDRVRVHPTATSAIDLAMNVAAHATGEEIAADEVTLLAPVPRPGKVICIGLNYRDHAAEGGNPIPDYPAVFLRGATSLVGRARPSSCPTARTSSTSRLSLASIIGKTATNVRDSPLDYVAGYCCFNDGTIRDYQRKSSQWSIGKNFDLTGAFSPDLVTPDELPTGAAGLRITSRVNGEIMQDGDTGDMIFDVATLITILSEAMTLEPGDVIATGTPAGVGYAKKPPVFLREGDQIEIEIERIGKATNPIARRNASRP